MTIDPNELRRLAEEANQKKADAVKQKALERIEAEAQAIIAELPGTLKAAAEKGHLSFNYCPIVDAEVAKKVIEYCKSQGLKVFGDPGDGMIDISWEAEVKPTSVPYKYGEKFDNKSGKNYELCPEPGCGKSAKSWCRCMRSDSTCVDGHSWHIDNEGLVRPGDSHSKKNR